MNNRPRFHAVQDANHNLMRDYLYDHCQPFKVAPKRQENEHGDLETVAADVLAYTFVHRMHRGLFFDTSKFGGIFPDGYVEMDTKRSAWLEVKTETAYKRPNHDLRPGEKWLMENCLIAYRILVVQLDFRNVLDELIEERQ